MLALTALLLLHSVGAAVPKVSDTTAAARSHEPATKVASVHVSDVSVSEQDRGKEMSKILVLPASARALPPLQPGPKSPVKQASGAGLIHKIGGAFHKSKSQPEIAGHDYIYPDSDFSFDTDSDNTSHEQ
jgi:hypothetical protein